MSSESFKFDWMRTVARDRRLSDSAARVLMFVAVNNVRSGEDTFRVRQETLATNLGVSLRTVIRALQQARDCGFLELATERQRGRGYRQGNTYRLIPPPGIGDSAVTLSDNGIGDSAVTSSDQEYVTDQTGIGDRSDQEYVTDQTGIGDRSGSENTHLPGAIATLRGIHTGFSNGVESAGFSAHAGAHAREGVFSALFGRTAQQPDELVPAPLPWRVPDPPPDTDVIDAEVIDAPVEAAPYGRCEVCTVALRDDGKCPRCLLRTGGWRPAGDESRTTATSARRRA